VVQPSIRCVHGVSHEHLRNQRSFSMKDGLLLGRDTQFLIISIAPNLFHVVPVSYDATLDGILEVEDTHLCLGFISSTSVSVCAQDGRYNAPDECVLVVHADRVLLRARSTDDGSAERCQRKHVVAYRCIREDCIRLVIPCNCKIQSSGRYNGG